MRAASLCIGLLLLVAVPATAVEPPQCRHLNRQIEHYSEMQDRAEELKNEQWEDRLGDHIQRLKQERKRAGCKETAAEAAERRIAELTKLLKAAAQGAVTFFTMGAM